MPPSADRPVREAENRLERFNADRARLLAQVERRVVARKIDAARAGGDASLEYVLNDVAFCETRRHDATHDEAGAARWRELSGRLLAMSEDEKRGELRELVGYYGKDIVGNFDPRVYKLIAKIGPSLLNFVFSPVASVRDGLDALSGLDARITADGEVELARACAERGTIVVVPTHSSNMDSPVIGLGLVRARLPPVTYGAGKNLFTNPFISYFMRNLGAYRVDRRLKFELYKDVLKEYSTVLLENGYHSLFFPGGTRCRSNIVEKHLKLGLLGTTVTAYKNLVREGGAHKRIYIVPATINYRLTLEAETLIDDYLAETGKNRYIIVDDEFSRIGRLTEFFRKILAHEGSVVVRFGRPLDVFGNDITDDGESLDRAGRAVDPTTFIRGANGEVSDDDQRDAEYTRALGRRLSVIYPSLTVFHATHLLARVMFDAVARRAGTRDIYRLLRIPPNEMAVPMTQILADLEHLRGRIAGHPAWGSEHPMLAPQNAQAVVDDAVRGLSTYHTRPIVSRRSGPERSGPERSGAEHTGAKHTGAKHTGAKHDDALHALDLKLLYYYQNRTAHIPATEVRP